MLTSLPPEGQSVATTAGTQAEAPLRSGSSEYNFGPSDLSSPAELGRQKPFADWAATIGTDWASYIRERPGMSVEPASVGRIGVIKGAVLQGERRPVGQGPESSPRVVLCPTW